MAEFVRRPPTGRFLGTSAAKLGDQQTVAFPSSLSPRAGAQHKCTRHTRRRLGASSLTAGVKTGGQGGGSQRSLAHTRRCWPVGAPQVTAKFDPPTKWRREEALAASLRVAC